MTRSKLIRLVDSDLIEDAIKQAELLTTGEICVSFSRYFWGDVKHAATKCFKRLGVSNTAKNNGVLIFVVPSRRKFIVLGDRGIHEKVPVEFWNAVATSMSKYFKSDDYTGGLTDAIKRVGRELQLHFPVDKSSGTNELVDQIDFT